MAKYNNVIGLRIWAKLAFSTECSLKVTGHSGFKGTCYITKKSFTDGETLEKNLIFEWPVTLQCDS